MRQFLCLSAFLAAAPAAAEPRSYVVDGAASIVTVHVGRGGLFGFAGHEHEVVATAVTGEVVADAEQVSRSTVRLEFASAGLKVTGTGEPAQDVPKVQTKMAGPEVLEVARFPAIVFRSSLVEGRVSPDGTWNLRIVGELELRGVRRPLTLPLRVSLSGDALVASGQAVLKQRDFGITPVSVAGLVKVKNELGVDYKIVAHAAP